MFGVIRNSWLFYWSLSLLFKFEVSAGLSSSSACCPYQFTNGSKRYSFSSRVLRFWSFLKFSCLLTLLCSFIYPPYPLISLGYQSHFQIPGQIIPASLTCLRISEGALCLQNVRPLVCLALCAWYPGKLSWVHTLCTKLELCGTGLRLERKVSELCLPLLLPLFQSKRCWCESGPFFFYLEGYSWLRLAVCLPLCQSGSAKPSLTWAVGSSVCSRTVKPHSTLAHSLNCSFTPLLAGHGIPRLVTSTTTQCSCVN